jgi:ankyrin repeat protein
MQQNPEAFRESAATLLLCKHLTPSVPQVGSDESGWNRLAYNWSSLLLSKDLLRDQMMTQKQQLSQILCCCKVFDSYVYFTPDETVLLSEAYSAGRADSAGDRNAVSSEDTRVMKEERQQFFRCLVSSRRRVDVYKGTPFAEVLSCVDYSEVERKEKNAGMFRKAFQNENAVSVDTMRAKYCQMDTDSNGTLDHEELKIALKELYIGMSIGGKSLAQPPDLDIMIQDTISVLDKNDSNSITFRQFASFFFGGADVNRSQQQESVKKKKRTRHRVTRKQESGGPGHQPAALPNRHRVPSANDVTVVIPMTPVPSHILFHEVSLIGKILPASMKRKDGGESRNSPQMTTQPNLLVQGGNALSTDGSVLVTCVPKSVCMENGTFFYEVEIITFSSAAVLRIGWADVSFVGGEIARGEQGSWAVSGKRLDAEADDFEVGEDSSSQEKLQCFGVDWTSGTVIGCLASFDEIHPDLQGSTCTFRYCLNGQWDAGILVEKEKVRIGVMPAVTMSSGCEVRMNLGERPFRYPNAGFKGFATVFDWIMEKQQSYVAQAEDTAQPQCHAACGQSSVLIETKTTAHGSVDSTFLINPNWDNDSCSWGAVTIKVAGLLEFRGKWFYEVVLPSYPDMHVGWAGPEFVPDFEYPGRKVGDDPSSWGFRVSCWQPKLLHGKRNTLSPKTRQYKHTFKNEALRKAGAIIGCAIDLDRGTMRFYFQSPESRECEDLGMAFEGMQIEGGLFPAVSAWSWENYEISVGKSLCHRPPEWLKGYTPVENYFEHYLDLESSVGNSCRTSSRASKSISRQIISSDKHLNLRVTSVPTCWLVVDEDRGRETACSAPQMFCVRGLNGYPSAKVDQVSLDSGAWYYEVQVLETDEEQFLRDTKGLDEEDYDKDEDYEACKTYLSSVGWSDSSFVGRAELGLGLGHDRFSYGHCGLATGGNVGRHNSRIWVGDKRSGNGYKKTGREWQVNDVVGCMIDFSLQKIVFVHHRGVNEPCIKIFKDLPFSRKMSATISVAPFFRFAIDFGSTPSKDFADRMEAMKKISGTQNLCPVFNHSNWISKQPPAGGSKTNVSRAHAASGTRMDTQEKTLIVSLEDNTQLSYNPDETEQTRICIYLDNRPGLKWKEVGLEMPNTGSEIQNDSLAAALLQKNDFSPTEFDKFNVATLFYDSYIKAGDKYFADISIKQNASNEQQLTMLTNALKLLGKTRAMCLHIVGPMRDLDSDNEADAPVLEELNDAFEAALTASRSCLKELRFVACHMSLRGWGIRALAAALDEHDKLEVLELVACDLRQTGARVLGEALEFTSSLRELKVHSAQLDGISVRHLIMPINPEHSLSCVDLSYNMIDASGAPALATLLQSYPVLKKLILAHNGLGFGSLILAKELEYNDSLAYLDVSHNQISHKGAAAIAKALRSNRTLKHLNVSKNNISEIGMKEFEMLFSEPAHSIKEFVFWEDAVPEEARINLLFSLNRKPMHLIEFGKLVKLVDEQDWQYFFHRPLCYAILCQWVFPTRNYDKSNQQVGQETVPAKSGTMISKELIEQLIRHRNSLAMKKHRLHYSPEKFTAPMHVRRCDARDALRIAICMLKSTGAAGGSGDSAWMIDQMLGKDGHLGIMLETKRDFIAREPTSAFDTRTASYWNQSDVRCTGNQVYVQEAEYLIDLWSCGEQTNKMYEPGPNEASINSDLFANLITQRFRRATGRHTALTLAVSHSWEVERYSFVAQRILRRNSYHKCVIVDKNGESSYEYMIRDQLHHHEDEGNPDLERGLTVFEAYPDLCNINARWEEGDPSKKESVKEDPSKKESVKVSALGLSVLAGMGDIVSIMLRKNAMHHWEYNESSSSGIDEILSYDEEKVSLSQLEEFWNNSPIIDRETGLSFISLVAQASPTAIVYMIDFAKGLLEKERNLISVPDKKGRLPFHYCAVNGHTQLFRMMVNACSADRVSAILNTLDADGYTALSLAVIHGQADIIKLLLKHGALVIPSTKRERVNLNSQGFDLCLLQNIFLDHEIKRIQEAKPPGLKWKSVGSGKPHVGNEIDIKENKQLVAALEKKEIELRQQAEVIEFSRPEFDKLNATPSHNSYIKLQDKYFQVVEEPNRTAELRNLQLAFLRSEKIQSIINENEDENILPDQVTKVRNDFVWNLLVRRMLKHVFVLGFLTIVAFSHSGQLGPNRDGFTMFRALVQDNLMHESFPEGESPAKYFADIGDDGDFWEWVSAVAVAVVKI